MLTWGRVLLLLALVGLAYLLQQIFPIVTIFLASAMLAYILLPPVDALARLIPRWLSVAVVFALFLAIVAGGVMLLIPKINEQIQVFLANWPRYQGILESRVADWSSRLGNETSTASLVQQLQGQLGKAWQLFGVAVGGVWSSSMILIGWGVNLVLIPVITFYLLKDWYHFVATGDSLLPRAHLFRLRALFAETDRVLGEFLRGQLLVMLGLGTMYSVGLGALGINLALPIGIFAGLISFIPYLGLFVGSGLALLMAAIQFHDVFHPLMVIAVFAGAQLVESTLLTPLLVGDRIGVHPVGVIFSVLAGERLYGVAGMLLALPVAAVITVWWRPVLDYYRGSRFYAGAAGQTVKKTGEESVAEARRPPDVV